MQQHDTSIQLDKNIAGLNNFTFRIGNVASIGFVNLNIPLGPVIFYIVLINTLFLLSLADINKLGAFFNIILNEVIQSQIQPA